MPSKPYRLNFPLSGNDGDRKAIGMFRLFGRSSGAEGKLFSLSQKWNLAMASACSMETMSLAKACPRGDVIAKFMVTLRNSPLRDPINPW